MQSQLSKSAESSCSILLNWSIAELGQPRSSGVRNLPWVRVREQSQMGNTPQATTALTAHCLLGMLRSLNISTVEGKRSHDAGKTWDTETEDHVLHETQSKARNIKDEYSTIFKIFQRHIETFFKLHFWHEIKCRWWLGKKHLYYTLLSKSKLHWAERLLK